MDRLENKTKIVATMGPASSPKHILKDLILNGVNVCRINFSHGDHKAHEETIQTIREVDAELGTFTAILGDLQGPKIRIGEVENNHVLLEDGKKLIITTNPCIGTAEKVYLNYTQFPNDVAAGERILIDDGKLVLEVLSANNKDEVVCEVIHGGPLSSKKGVNLPNTKVSLPCLTEKDLVDLEFIFGQDIDWVALSFVRDANDIDILREKIKSAGKDLNIVAKVEKPEAIENLDAIIDKTDAVMVARGDLGVEIPMQQVPLIQKDIVIKCRKQAKPVIIATQMMESMITNVSPTRAEVNDVANAVMDGADAVMLSGETSIGKFPLMVIQAMYKIIIHTEKYPDLYFKEFEPELNQDRFITDTVCYNAVRLAKRTSAKALVTMTFSGYTAYKISSARPKAGIYAFTGNARLRNKLSLVWGTKAFYYDKFESTDQTIEDVKAFLTEKKLVEKGDLIINTAAMPIADKGRTNMLKLSEA